MIDWIDLNDFEALMNYLKAHFVTEWFMILVKILSSRETFLNS